MGWSFVIYAVVLYPLIGIATGHGYPHLPMFGVTPCPVTIFTFGMLRMSDPVPRRLLEIPLVWSLIGESYRAGAVSFRKRPTSDQTSASRPTQTCPPDG